VTFATLFNLKIRLPQFKIKREERGERREKNKKKEEEKDHQYTLKLR
jgi:hypothetical protein